MNKKDKELYQALKFYADNTKFDIRKLKRDDPTEFNEQVGSKNMHAKSMEISLAARGLIKMDSLEKYMITDKGMEELRMLQRDHWKYYTWIISIISLIISIIALLKSFGLLEKTP